MTLAPPARGRVRWLLPVAVAGVTFAVFSPALRADFVNWDDDENFLDNPHYRGLSWAHLRWMFTFIDAHYQPLSWVTLGFDHVLWGMNPAGYHLTNLLLHAANAVWVYVLLGGLVRRTAPAARVVDERGVRWAAAAGALLFAVHPLRVESVAWVTERRDVLSGLFILPAVLAYLSMQDAPARRRARGGWFAASIACTILSLFSKAWGITLPALLLLLDVYPLGRLRAATGTLRARVWVVVEKLPYLALAVPFAVLAAVAQRDYMEPLSTHPPSSRIAQGAYGVCFYLWKTVVPVRLSPYYDMTPPLDPTAPRYALCLAAVAAITAALVALRRRWPAGLAAWCAYLAILAPVLGFAQSGSQLAADRYTYFACLPWAALAAAGLYRLRLALAVRPQARPRGRLAAGGVAAILAVLAALAYRQTHVWRDSVTLWTQALAIEPDNVVARNNLGSALIKLGRVEEGRRYYTFGPERHLEFGRDFETAGRVDEAITHYELAVALDPEHAGARMALAGALARRQRYDLAIEHWTRVVETHPESVDALNGLGLASQLLGRTDDAIAYYTRAIAAAPDDMRGHYGLATLYLQQGRAEEAAAQWGRVLVLAPDHPGARNGLGLALLALGRVDEAEVQFGRALASAPDDADTLANLGLVRERQGRTAEAVVLWRRALRASPAHPNARAHLERVTGEPAPPAPPAD